MPDPDEKKISKEVSTAVSHENSSHPNRPALEIHQIYLLGEETIERIRTIV